MPSPRSALGHRFVVECTDPGLAAELDRLFAALPSPTGSSDTTRLTVTPHSVAFDGQYYFTHPTRVITTVVNAVTALATSRPGAMLHAGGVQDGDAAIVVTGPQDAGKSTLVAALGLRDRPVLSDEVIRCDRGPVATGLRRPVRLDRGSEGLFPALFADRPVSAWATDTWHLSPNEFSPVVPDDALAISLVLIPARAAGVSPGLDVLDPAVAVTHLCENAFAPLGADDFAVLVEVAATGRVARFRYDDLDQACDLLAEQPDAPDRALVPASLVPTDALRLDRRVIALRLGDNGVVFNEATGAVVALPPDALAELTGERPPTSLTAQMVDRGFVRPMA